MRRRRREPPLRSSPFVVLSDMTIGLTFFFAVFSMVASLANSQAFAVAQRTERQTKVRDELSEAIGQLVPGTAKNWVESDVGDKYTELRKPDGVVMAQIWENGNFQRIRVIDPVYAFGSDRLNDFGRRAYAAMAPVFKAHAREFAYVFIHGIAEPLEGTPTALSRRRADAVSNLLRGLGVILPAEEAESGAPAPADAIASKFAITYGTGNELYTLSERRGSLVVRSRPGRVDIVVFFKEADTNGTSGTPASEGAK